MQNILKANNHKILLFDLLLHTKNTRRDSSHTFRNLFLERLIMPDHQLLRVIAEKDRGNLRKGDTVGRKKDGTEMYEGPLSITDEPKDLAQYGSWFVGCYTKEVYVKGATWWWSCKVDRKDLKKWADIAEEGTSRICRSDAL